MMTHAEQVAFRANDAELKGWRDALIVKRDALMASDDRPEFIIEGATYLPGAGNVLREIHREPVRFFSNRELESVKMGAKKFLAQYTSVIGSRGDDSDSVAAPNVFRMRRGAP